MNVGITGHQKLPNSLLWQWVEKEIIDFTANIENLVGHTSLAVGADQLFAEIILKNNGKLSVIVPFEDYKFKFESGEDREKYFYFLSLADKIQTLKRKKSDEAGYFAAGQIVVECSEVLIAVWNEKPAAGFGGTADVVAFARAENKKILLLNPLTQQVIRINF